jgi:hypothetical protein
LLLFSLAVPVHQRVPPVLDAVLWSEQNNNNTNRRSNTY